MKIKFHPLARAVIIDRDAILLAQQIDADNTFLPGGHITLGESIRQTLEREIREELGCASRIGNYLGAIEHLWEDIDGNSHHEINHFFVVAIAGLDCNQPPSSCEPHLRFIWSSLEELEDHNLLPVPLRALIRGYQAGDHSTWWATTLAD